MLPLSLRQKCKWLNHKLIAISFFILLHRRERENSFYVLLIIPKKILRTLNANFVPILFYNFMSKSREFTWFIFFSNPSARRTQRTRKSDLQGTTRHREGWPKSKRESRRGMIRSKPFRKVIREPSKSTAGEYQLTQLPYRSGGFGREDQNRFETTELLTSIPSGFVNLWNKPRPTIYLVAKT